VYQKTTSLFANPSVDFVDFVGPLSPYHLTVDFCAGLTISGITLSTGDSTMQRKAVLYLRVSTLDQTTANQERELREVADRMGVEVVKTYRDHGVSGAKGRDKRPQFDALCRDAARRAFDLVLCWSVDRLGRSLQDLIAFLSEIHALHIDLYLHQQGLDTQSPSGKAMFGMMGIFAELERSLIQERVRAWLARARSEGKQLGRPRIDHKMEHAIQAALKQKDRPGVRQIAASFGVSAGTVQRISRELR
jgi:DNA invertase Pin-like site-specific DNA recombinase